MAPMVCTQSSHIVGCLASPSNNGHLTQRQSTVILPGLGNNTGDYAPLSSALRSKGFPVKVLKVSRLDWLRNAAGLLDGNYWRGTLKPRPVLDWYLERIKVSIDAVKAKHGHDKVSLIAHSAGGWLARVFMLEFGTDDISLLLTLGTPHLPPPKGVPGVFDQTRGLLDYVEEKCPGAFHAPQVKYVCIASRYIKGATRSKSPDAVVAAGVGSVTTGTLVETIVESDEEEIDDVEELTPSYEDRLIGQGYKQVCGRGDVWGDGVVPAMSAHLRGATNITFDGVYHSPVGANDEERPWYGSPKVLDEWIKFLE
ncbi:uncharacterized protein LOC9662278 [Selaginella moellendorffii]|uniref:uncharacterized protein LOC9662278 n=1 Tax=Selaginella moellendorffii TaxID=88036 RepID=UPI000D1C7D13|nr:uncharacterized protein LOC9662278 [Selaginella moellendorffii]|eukprot:XP_024518499.1 uncharacterized protein LOC9662278 [Selaginella moellendorffii]